MEDIRAMGAKREMGKRTKLHLRFGIRGLGKTSWRGPIGFVLKD